MILKRLAALTLMVGVAGGALADDKVWDAGAIPLSPDSYYTVVTHAVGSFTDTVTFSVPLGTLGAAANILAVPNAAGGSNPFSGNISNLSYEIWQGATSYGSYASGPSVSHTYLAAGEYTLSVSGLANGTKGGTYGLDLAVLPVPEPTTYGMMAFGLGLLGFARRRRDASNDKFK
jgi:hypothetical protein